MKELSAQVDELLEMMEDEDFCTLDSEATSNFELLWSKKSLPTRNVNMRSDIEKHLHMPLHDLGCMGRCVIVPKCELPNLIIPVDCDACYLDMFWGTVVEEYYDPLLAIEMFRILLFGPWGTHNVPEAVCKFVDENSVYGKVSEIQLWGSRLRTPSPSNQDTSDCSYIPGQDSPQESNDIDKLDNLELTPNSHKWFLSNSNPSNELGLECNLSFHEFSNLPPRDRFAEGMWNSPSTNLPPLYG